MSSIDTSPPDFQTLLARWNRGVSRGAQTKFARLVGVAPNTVSQWVRGVSQPAEDLLPKVAKALEVAQEKLDRLFVARRAALQAAMREPSPVWPQGTDGASDVPVYGTISKRFFQFSFSDGIPEEFLPISIRRPGHRRYAALRVSGTFLKPMAQDGDYLLVAEAASAPDGKWAVVRGQEGCRVRRLSPGKHPDSSQEIVGVIAGLYSKL